VQDLHTVQGLQHHMANTMACTRFVNAMHWPPTSNSRLLVALLMLLYCTEPGRDTGSRRPHAAEGLGQLKAFHKRLPGSLASSFHKQSVFHKQQQVAAAALQSASAMTASAHRRLTHCEAEASRRLPQAAEGNQQRLVLTQQVASSNAANVSLEL
jgi:hypothetical protein